jgi:uncharacterized protein
MAEFYAPEVVIEMPFATAGLYPARIETTREELRARFRAGAAARRYRDLRDVVIHETADPGVVIAEYRLDGELAESAGSRSCWPPSPRASPAERRVPGSADGQAS